MIKRRLKSPSNLLYSSANRSYTDLLACDKCSLISSPIVSYEQLMNVETKYLRLYLLNRRVSILGYNEKKDLALLILNYNCENEQNNPINFNITESVQRVNSDSLTDNSTQNSASVHLITNENSITSPVEANSSEIPANLQPNNSIPAQTVNTNSQVQNPIRKHASLSDLNSVDDIEGLNIRQIKEILAFNFVDYRDCFERPDLVERLKRLYNSTSENKANQSDPKNDVLLSKEPTDNSASNELNSCKICMDSPIDCVLLNCGKHFLTLFKI
jgi:E3 ubiquitin-protein ligase RNF34